MPQILVFTDLDGSLLDHHTYSHQPADAMLEKLESQDIPVICCTSKTRQELEAIRLEINNRHPFIAENGAVIFIPRDYFQRPPEGCDIDGEYWVKSFCEKREYWQQIIARCRKTFEDAFVAFSDAGIESIAEMTGLNREQATAAAQREYGEPLKWLGDQQTLQAFIDTVAAEGAHVLVGGRFVHVSGAIDKGRALTWLLQQYQANEDGRDIVSIAIGDSGNDIAMLNVADHALVVRSPAHGFPALARQEGVVYSEDYGPAGWSEGVEQLLLALNNNN